MALILKHFLLIALIGTLLACDDGEKLQPLKPGATILAFGDSLTYGTGTSREKAYPTQLAMLTGHNVINAGKPGETTSKGLLRLPGLIKQHQPELIIICHGANDILQKQDIQQTSSNIQLMINLARQNNSQVVLIGVPEFSLFLGSAPIYKVLADRNHIPLENDIISEILSDNTLKSDQIHPNAKGYRLLAESISQLLEDSGAITRFYSSNKSL
jgi:lysophospholipase L1-like esterase